MSQWLLLAIIGHLANAGAFFVDKLLLSAAFKRSATYAMLLGFLSGLLLLLFPLVQGTPQHLSDILLLFGFGAGFILALWAFFEALRQEEVSRVVPIVGTLVPLITLLGERLWFQTLFSSTQTIGIACLVFATYLFTRGSTKHQPVDIKVIGLAFTAALLFAITSLSGKAAFSRFQFLDVLVLSRVFSLLTATAIFFIVGKEARAEFYSLFQFQRSLKTKLISRRAALIAIGGQLLSGAGFVCIYLAIQMGSVAIVNSLQAVQYGFLVVIAWAGGKSLRTLLKEELSSTVVIQKSLGIVATGIGLWFLTRG